MLKMTTNATPPASDASTINSTSSTNNEFDLTRFIVLETTVSIFTLILVYLIVAMLTFQWKVTKAQRNSTHLKNDRTTRYSLTMFIESITAALFLLGRYICEHYELVAQYLQTYTFDYCNLIVKLKVILTAVAILGVYSFLWTRQRFCYTDPAMTHLTGRGSKIVSWISLGLLLIAQIVGTSLFTATRFYELTGLGCFNHEATIPSYIPWLFLVGATVCFQILLFGLFVDPLLKHRSLVKNNNAGIANTFLPIIQRATVTTSICIFTDIISSLLILLVNDQFEIIPTLAYDISILVNIICVFASFSNWKARLISPIFCWDAEEDKEDTSVHGNGSLRMTGNGKTSSNNKNGTQSMSNQFSSPGVGIEKRTSYDNKAMTYDDSV